MKLINTDVLQGAVIGLAMAAVLYFAFRPTPKPSIPVIVTKYDTVSVQAFKRDTIFLTKLRADTIHDTINLVERVVTPSKPDTIRITEPMTGILGVLAGERYAKDTTKIVTATISPIDTTGRFQFQSHLYGYYTPGPFRSVVLRDDGKPFVTFYDAPACHESRAFLTGAGLATVFIFGGKFALNQFNRH